MTDTTGWTPSALMQDDCKALSKWLAKRACSICWKCKAKEARIFYTTPQPTQPHAGAVPLTDEQIAEGFAKRSRHIGLFAGGVRFAERHHSIKGGQHGAE